MGTQWLECQGMMYQMVRGNILPIMPGVSMTTSKGATQGHTSPGFDHPSEAKAAANDETLHTKPNVAKITPTIPTTDILSKLVKGTMALQRCRNTNVCQEHTTTS